jgi:hypothetical protein
LHGTSNLDGTGTVKIYLYLPGQTCNSDGSGGTLEHTYSNVTTEGPFTAGPVTATQAGVYHWLAIFSGDGNNAGPVDSGCASEPVTILAQPTIDTNQTPVSGNVGDPISDSATLHNTSNLDGTGTVTIYLYAPGQTCAATGAGGTVVATYPNVTTNGPFTAGPVTATQVGVYHWLAVFTGDSNNPGPINSGCASEPVTIVSPFQGCTPGFWKNHQSVWDATTDPTVAKLLPFLVSPFGYDPTLTGPPTKQNPKNSFNNQPFFGYGSNKPPFPSPGIFGLPTGPFGQQQPTMTLIGALNNGGGAFAALSRHATAALLSSVSVKYTYTTQQILTGVRNAFISGNPNQMSPTFPDGILNDLESANQQNEQACPTS